MRPDTCPGVASWRRCGAGPEGQETFGLSSFYDIKAFFSSSLLVPGK